MATNPLPLLPDKKQWLRETIAKYPHAAIFPGTVIDPPVPVVQTFVKGNFAARVFPDRQVVVWLFASEEDMISFRFMMRKDW